MDFLKAESEGKKERDLCNGALKSAPPIELEIG
jgi:hypothetical protein